MVDEILQTTIFVDYSACCDSTYATYEKLIDRYIHVLYKSI